MVGNENDARDAKDGLLTPWTNLGSSRCVYRVGNVVYKVERERYVGDNQREWKNYQWLSKSGLPYPFALPKTELYSFADADVIAMEFVEGIPVSECFCDFHMEPHGEDCLVGEELDEAQCYISDVGGANIIKTPDGRYVLIDLVT